MISEIIIKIEGRMDEKWVNYFNDLIIHYDNNSTVFSGKIQDESYLHGILNRIRDLNLKLISVNRLTENI